jgi:hypothetical protein
MLDKSTASVAYWEVEELPLSLLNRKCRVPLCGVPLVTAVTVPLPLWIRLQCDGAPPSQAASSKLSTYSSGSAPISVHTVCRKTTVLL